MEEEIKSYASNEIGESSTIPNYHHPSASKMNHKNGFQDEDDGLGPMPLNWEKAITENGEIYFIDHTTGQSHWLDPRLRNFQKKSLEECEDDELPYGWERIVDPEYGIYYIDHVNRRTQYENPVIQAKRSLEMQQQQQQRLEVASNYMPETVDLPLEPKNFFTKNPAELLGERIQTTLVKSQRGLGFTVIGGDCNDENIDEFLQIKSIVPNSPASFDGKLKTGDILVFVNHICVLGFTHHEMVNIFQSIMPGDEVHLDVCRGYKLPFDPSDPNTEIVTTIAVNGLNDDVEKNRLYLDILNDNYNFLDMSNDADLSFKNQSAKSSFEIPEIHDIIIIKGDQGFGFTIAESNLWGQKVKKILDRQCCKDLMEGDILLSINNINIKNLTHNEVVQVLKECPKNQETILRVQRGLIRSSLNKFNGKVRSKLDSAGTSNDQKSITTNGLYRSKTPTADIYSTQTKETLPIRPKTPLVDTRSRVQMKTPIQLNDLNTHDIELDSKLNDHDDMIIDDNKSTISTATTAYDTTKLLTEQFDNFGINDQRSDTYTTTDSITSKTSGGVRNRFFSPVDIKNGNDHSDYYYANSSHSYSLPPPPSIPSASQGHFIQPIQPLQNPSTIPYQHQPHDSCFCYDCQDYRLKQSQHSDYVSSSNNTSDYSLLQNQFNLPPQMSDNIGQRINNYLMDRKRGGVGSELYNNYHSYRPNGSAVDDFYYVEVTLERQQMSYVNSDGTQSRGTFGFRIVGGTEEGSQVCVGYIVKDGPADRDPRIQTGDEIVNINGVNVECASHHLVVKLMNDAALLGQVTMLLRKRKPQNLNNFYRPPQSSYVNQPVIPNTYDVIINRQEHEGFGFVIISSSNQSSGSTIGKIIPNSPADNGQLKIGDRIIRVNDNDITNMSHGDVVKIIKDSGLTVVLTVSNSTIARSSDFIINEGNHSPYNSNINTNSSNSNPLNMNSFPMIT
ncbi:hypothetical protein PVAND_002665 [Polypedilum vanderplanki]|uniref:Uncharacterized protein n=1 Tax=Polypedilum vanderplanki TaxID=319348 RepID=A0A9J6BS64_POLVA|nr:hypothetical protein PVAND_002665 [Polypedilum vanderplanki]